MTDPTLGGAPILRSLSSALLLHLRLRRAAVLAVCGWLSIALFAAPAPAGGAATVATGVSSVLPRAAEKIKPAQHETAHVAGEFKLAANDDTPPAKAEPEATPKPATETPAPKPAEASPRHGGILGVLLYVPNRIFDLLDIFRLRVRVGPGIAVGARATSAGAVYLGTYVSVWGGLPGPRMARKVPLPAGLETHNGATLSLADATADASAGPNYSPTECGVSLHLLIIGIDLDVDPVEAGDFATGILGIDLRKDDL